MPMIWVYGGKYERYLCQKTQQILFQQKEIRKNQDDCPVCLFRRIACAVWSYDSKTAHADYGLNPMGWETSM